MDRPLGTTTGWLPQRHGTHNTQTTTRPPHPRALRPRQRGCDRHRRWSARRIAATLPDPAPDAQARSRGQNPQGNAMATLHTPQRPIDTIWITCHWWVAEIRTAAYDLRGVQRTTASTTLLTETSYPTSRPTRRATRQALKPSSQATSSGIKRPATRQYSRRHRHQQPPQ